MRPPPLLALVLALVLVLELAACGGPKAPANATARPDAGAGAADAGPSFAVSPPPSGLPPMATMPPPGVLGSRKAKRKPDAALASCSGAFEARAKDPAAQVKRVGDACAPPSKMKQLGPPLRGQQGDRDPSQDNRFKAEANHCYRVYVAADEGVKDVVAVLRDSAGDIVAEAPGPAVPADGQVCFTASDDVTVLVGVGSGKGAWAAQVWGD
jgi:hypothetical protein